MAELRPNRAALPIRSGHVQKLRNVNTFVDNFHLHVIPGHKPLGITTRRPLSTTIARRLRNVGNLDKLNPILVNRGWLNNTVPL